MWNENLLQAFLKMDDETIQKMLDKLRYIVEVDTVRNPTPAFQAMIRMVQEQKQTM